MANKQKEVYWDRDIEFSDMNSGRSYVVGEYTVMSTAEKALRWIFGVLGLVAIQAFALFMIAMLSGMLTLMILSAFVNQGMSPDIAGIVFIVVWAVMGIIFMIVAEFVILLEVSFALIDWIKNRQYVTVLD